VTPEHLRTSSVLIQLGSHGSPSALLAMGLSAVILSVLVRLVRALGPSLVRIYRAHTVREAVREFRDKSRTASETAIVIDALTRFEIAAHDRDRHRDAGGHEVGRQVTPVGSAPPIEELAAELPASPGKYPRPPVAPPVSADPARAVTADRSGRHVVPYRITRRG
jgi:hypothetical protein